MSSFALVLAATLFVPILAEPGQAEPPPADDLGWAEAGHTGDVVVYNRDHQGSEVKEGKALAVFDAPSWVVKNVIDDVGRYSEFMPYTREAKIVERGSNYIISYQRLNPPFVANRDYTLRIEDQTKRLAGGSIVYKVRWTRAKGYDPKPIDDVVRMPTNDGSWTLEDIDGKRTRATYWVYTVPGGSIPTWLVNATNTTAVGELFGAVRKALSDPRYRVKHPPVPGDAPMTTSPAPIAAPPAAPTPIAPAASAPAPVVSPTAVAPAAPKPAAPMP